jgi:hypothetical protein
MLSKATQVRSLLVLLVLMFFQTVKAQQARYVYIQSENNQLFNVQLNGKNYSSNSTGYLLIPQLTSGNYTIRLGFPRSTALYNFNLPIGQDDRGFSLKLGVDNNWSLFDMVSFNVIAASAVTEKAKETEEIRAPATPVSSPLSQEVKKTVETKQAADAELTPKTTVVTTPAPVAAKTTKHTLQPIIRKIYEKAGTEGVDLVYEVPNGNKMDTVILFVPHLAK